MSAKSLLTSILLASGVFSGPAPAGDAVAVTDGRCESQTDPLGVDIARPHLSWRLESSVRGQGQSAYHVLVSSSREKLDQDVGDLWDSGKVDTEQSRHVEYAGAPLRANMDCHWKVRVWPTLSGATGDNGSKSSSWSRPAKWTMGLLGPGDPSASKDSAAAGWQAQWIGAPPASVAGGEVIIKKATYRTLDGKVEKDVTEIARRPLAKGTRFTADFRKRGGDPAGNVVKELVVEFVRDGKPGVARAKDFEEFSLGGPRGDPAPLFRREFDLAAAPGSATVTVHSPAYFELYVNGAKVGKDVLTPAVSNLKHQSFSVTYDVSPHLRSGRNCLGLWLGRGRNLLLREAPETAVGPDRRAGKRGSKSMVSMKTASVMFAVRTGVKFTRLGPEDTPSGLSKLDLRILSNNVRVL